MKIVHVGGAKGVGKTTAMAELAKFSVPDQILLPVTISGLLYKSAMEAFGRPWSELIASERNDARRNVRNTLFSLPADTVFLDSHYVDMIEGNHTPIFPEEMKVVVDIHIVLEADPMLILSRRIKDTGIRDRNVNIDMIMAEIQGEREEALRIAGENCSPIHVFDNIDVGLTTGKIIEISGGYLANQEREGNYESIVHNRERF